MFTSRTLLGLATMIFLLAVPLVAQDIGMPDTVYFGYQGKAYGYPGGIYRVPVYIYSDQSVLGIELGLEFGLGSSPQVYDSLSKIGTIFLFNQYFDLTGHGLVVSTNSDNLVNPDTIGFMGIGTDYPLPPGLCKIGDFFFHGANIGDQIVVDTANFPPAWIQGMITVGTPNSQRYMPQIVAGTLTIVPNTAEFFTTIPDQVGGITGQPVTFSFQAASAYEPTTIVFDSLRRVAPGLLPYVAPICATGNPITFNWVTMYYESGTWKAYFTVLDNAGHSEKVTTNIEMAQGMFYGDVNCDGVIDISDAVFLINFIFTPGAPLPCGQKK
jgi:hypothetical protein